MLPILYGFNNSLSYLYFGFRYCIWQQNSFCAILNNGHLISVCRFMCIGIHAFHECDSCSCSGQCPASSHDIWSFGTIYAFWGLQCTWPISTYRKLILSCVWGGSRWWPSADELMNVNLYALKSMLCSHTLFSLQIVSLFLSTICLGEIN